MRLIIRDALVTVTLTTAISIGLAAGAPQEHQHPGTHPEGGAHRHPEAAKLKNPVAADATSVAAGKQLYDKQCAGCHGDTGKGDGAMGEELNPKPANLADADWKHGSTDGEIYTVIRDGVKSTGMKPYARKLTTHQIWDVVNYVRSLAKAG
jgi:mono/diheme cytochrome c family protein